MDNSLNYDYLVILGHYKMRDSTPEISELYFHENGEYLMHYDDGNAREAKTYNEGELSLAYWRSYHQKHRGLEKNQYFHLVSRIHDRRCQPVRKLKKEIREYEKNQFIILTLLSKTEASPGICIIYPRKRIFIFTFYKGGKF